MSHFHRYLHTIPNTHSTHHPQMVMLQTPARILKTLTKANLVQVVTEMIAAAMGHKIMVVGVVAVVNIWLLLSQPQDKELLLLADIVEDAR